MKPEIKSLEAGGVNLIYFIHIIHHKQWAHPKNQWNVLLVKPNPVRIDAFSKHYTVGCSLRVQWQLLDTGNCKVDYNIEFLNNCGTILGAVTGIRNNVSFYCTNAYPNSTSEAMWAVWKGIKGIKTKVVALFTTPKTIITDRKGMNIVFLSFFGLFFPSARNQGKKTLPFSAK